MANAFVKSDRLQKLPPYLFAEIDRKKKAAIAAGKDVINLGVGDPDRPTPKAIIESLQAEFASKELSKPSSLKERRHTDGTIGICTEREEPPHEMRERKAGSLIFFAPATHTQEAQRALRE